jgi:hypothetical protein
MCQKRWEMFCLNLLEVQCVGVAYFHCIHFLLWFPSLKTQHNSLERNTNLKQIILNSKKFWEELNACFP